MADVLKWEQSNKRPPAVQSTPSEGLTGHLVSARSTALGNSKPSPDFARDVPPRDPFTPRFSIAKLFAVANHFGYTISPDTDNMMGPCVLLVPDEDDFTDEGQIVREIIQSEIDRYGSDLTRELFHAFMWHSRIKAEILRAIPYADYLKSKHWAETRQEALERAMYSCQVCNATENLHVHHRTYERRGEEAPDDLTVLCAKCHQLFHKNGKVK